MLKTYINACAIALTGVTAIVATVCATTDHGNALLIATHQYRRNTDIP